MILLLRLKHWPQNIFIKYDMLLYIELSNEVHKIAGRGAGNACSCTCYKNLIYHNTTQRVAILLLINTFDRSGTF